MKNLTAADIAKALAENVETVCRYLLPNGVLKAGEWCAGDPHGSAGNSCKVRVSGSKAGVWSDFNGGQSGDLLDLWSANKNISIAEAMKEAKAYLGISEPETFHTKPKLQFAKPKKPKSLAKLGSVLSDWFAKRKITPETLKIYRVAEAGGAIVYQHIIDNKLVSIRYRKLPKDFSNSTNTAHTLWGWHTLSERSRSVVICEGYEDAMSWREYGIEALSVPFGAGTGNKHQWIDHDYERLQQFDRIYISMDMDEAGLGCVEEIATRLGNYRCFVVELPKKDCNDCLIAGIAKDVIADTIKNAKAIDPKHLRRADSYLDQTIRLFFPTSDYEAGFSLPWSHSGNLIFRPGELIVHTGFNGSGKSQWVNYLEILMMNAGYKCATASMEFQPKRLLHRMVKQITGIGTPTEAYIKESFQWLDGKFWLFGATGNDKAGNLLDTMLYARKRYGVEVFIIDSFMKCGINEEDYDGQKKFMDQLSDFKNDFECQIHLVVHQRKPANVNEVKATPSKFGIKGSGSISDLPDTIVLINRNKKKEFQVNKILSNNRSMTGIDIPKELKNMPDVYVNCDKQRNGDWEGGFGLHFNTGNYQYKQYYREKNRDFLQHG
jgi:twinkle protein